VGHRHRPRLDGTAPERRVALLTGNREQGDPPFRALDGRKAASYARCGIDPTLVVIQGVRWLPRRPRDALDHDGSAMDDLRDSSAPAPVANAPSGVQPAELREGGRPCATPD